MFLISVSVAPSISVRPGCGLSSSVSGCRIHSFPRSCPASAASSYSFELAIYVFIADLRCPSNDALTTSFGTSFLRPRATPALEYCTFRRVYGVETLETRLFHSSLPLFSKYPIHSPYTVKASTSPSLIKVLPLDTGEYPLCARTVLFRRPLHLSRVHRDKTPRISPVIENGRIT